MRKIKLITIIIFLAFNNQVMADTLFKDGFNETGNWEYIADDVMGGVSKGKVQFKKVNGDNHAILSGEVSTKNNGGFIQIRTRIDPSEPKDKTGIKIKVKGNGDVYYLHIRNASTRLPWHYYTASFQTSEKWKDITIPFDEFEKSATLMPRKLKADTIKTIGLVAYGKDHNADVSIANLEFY